MPPSLYRALWRASLESWSLPEPAPSHLAATPKAEPRELAAGAIYLVTRAGDSGSQGKLCARLSAGREVGDRPRRCGPCCWIVPRRETSTILCIAVIRRSSLGPVLRRFRYW